MTYDEMPSSHFLLPPGRNLEETNSEEEGLHKIFSRDLPFPTVGGFTTEEPRHAKNPSMPGTRGYLSSPEIHTEGGTDPSMQALFGNIINQDVPTQSVITSPMGKSPMEEFLQSLESSTTSQGDLGNNKIAELLESNLSLGGPDFTPFPVIAETPHTQPVKPPPASNLSRTYNNIHTTNKLSHPKLKLYSHNNQTLPQQRSSTPRFYRIAPNGRLTQSEPLPRTSQYTVKNYPTHRDNTERPTSYGNSSSTGRPPGSTENGQSYSLHFDSNGETLDTRTTLMIKNIPNKYSQKMLLEEIDTNHPGVYDFFYLPIDFKNKCNVGYAFINMVSTNKIAPFYKEFNNKHWSRFNSEKICEITYARIQGLVPLIDHFKCSSLLAEEEKVRPVMLLDNKLQPFPVSVSLRVLHKDTEEGDYIVTDNSHNQSDRNE
ncbi:meiosis protein [Pelomyxa schiedti]|nr:meiosis protein [Pelomyxa schiedti]